MKELYDRRMRDARYAEGDRVWLHNPRRRRGLSPKLQSPWKGPYTVMAVPSAVTYKMRRGHKRALVVHADRLWRYHGSLERIFFVPRIIGQCDAPSNQMGYVNLGKQLSSLQCHLHFVVPTAW
ncbi:hypothetical protein E2C01_014899 [Portunus trituberculatus]|uniref:Integrase p58-like C-terminal domain-containing protein n=1 Tax=Portunus trituberculatus TaxID=210409 RepID=A0A5B7DLP2_PORTR|nr:hypothetical protein [Portunus trituberculatus]